MTELALSIEAAVDRVAAGERAADLATAHLAALERAGKALNAVARLEPDTAAEMAAALERHRCGAWE